MAHACEDLGDVDWMREHLDDEVDWPDEMPERSLGSLPGPVANAALSEVFRVCEWGIPYSDGAFTVSLLAIAADAQQELADAMAASSLYTERTEHSSTIYSRTLDGSIGAGGFAHARLRILGDLRGHDGRRGRRVCASGDGARRGRLEVSRVR